MGRPAWADGPGLSWLVLVDLAWPDGLGLVGPGWHNETSLSGVADRSTNVVGPARCFYAFLLLFITLYTCDK